MTPEELLEKHCPWLCDLTDCSGGRGSVLEFAEAVAAKEREACALIADGYHRIDEVGEIGREIRKRGEA